VTLKAEIVHRARALGFDKVGVARSIEHADFLREWLNLGYAGEMEYLATSAAKRMEITRFLPGAQSVVVVALNYWTGQAGRRVSCYAWGQAYQDLMMARLETLKAFVVSRGATAKITVDAGAMMEKRWAAAAGVGWTGKHSLQLDAELGSWFYLGVLVTDAVLDPDPPATDLCGACTACIEACPTGAIVEPYVVDSRKCISYLTIEKRGPIDDALKPEMGEWLFGCDVCQEVCPHNAKAPRTDEAAFQPIVALLEPMAMLAGHDFTKTGVARAKRAGLARNAAIALGNAGDAAAIPALQRALKDRDEGVRDAATWAIRRLGGTTPSADRR
jgi:epoxyqueuosine reductase